MIVYMPLLDKNINNQYYWHPDPLGDTSLKVTLSFLGDTPLTPAWEYNP